MAAVVSGGIDVVHHSALVDRAWDAINTRRIYIGTNNAAVWGMIEPGMRIMTTPCRTIILMDLS